jgi:hypothetical protein
MDTHTNTDTNNPINHTHSEEDLQIIKDEKIIDLLDSLADDFLGDTPSEYLSKKEDLTDVNNIYDDLLINGYFTEEIIYYYNAIKYLKDNDQSLSESLEIANEYGYSITNINSELLATLHASRNKEDKFWQHIAPELENIINNL